MNAFEIGLIIGMLTFTYVVYEAIKYEPLDKVEKH